MSANEAFEMSGQQISQKWGESFQWGDQVVFSTFSGKGVDIVIAE